MATGYLDNFYARLGISKNATQEEIRDAYHKAARRLHPDTNGDEDATELFLNIQEAYETLSNAAKRQAYDSLLPEDIDPAMDVMVNAIYSRSVLPKIQNTQLVYVLLDLMAPIKESVQRRQRPPRNLCIVLDTSTSMSGPRLDMVKTTALEIVRQLQGVDVISLVAFNDKATVVVPAARGQDLNVIEAQISKLMTTGGTEILQGLKAGLNEVARNLNPAYINHLILITDGRTYGDEEESLKAAEVAANRGITISGLGIGTEWNDEFLDALASITGGTSAYATGPDSIRRILRGQFDLMSQVYANKVALQFNNQPNVDLRYVFRLTPDAGSIQAGSPLIFGNIPLHGSLSLIMEFLIENIPEKAKEVVLLDGELNFSIPTQTIPNSKTKIRLMRNLAPDPAVEPPPQVLVRAMSRLSLYRLQEQARLELDAGDIEKATQRLNNLSMQLLAAGKPDLAHTVQLELKSLEKGDNISEEAKKRLKYGTRALVMPGATEALDE